MTKGSSLIGWSLGDVAGICASGATSAGVTRVDDGTFFDGTDGSSVALSGGALQINNALTAIASDWVMGFIFCKRFGAKRASSAFSVVKTPAQMRWLRGKFSRLRLSRS